MQIRQIGLISPYAIQIVKFMGPSEKLRSYGGANMAIEVSSLVKYIKKSLLSYFRKEKKNMDMES